MLVLAQVLGGNPNFPVLNEIQWEMKASEIQSLCANRWKETSNTDSAMVYSASFFGTSARVKIQVDPNSKMPRMIDIAFEQPTSAMRDTLVSRFTQTTGKAPFITTKEKSAIIFTIKLEMAIWKTGNETVSVMTAMRGSSIVALSIILAPTGVAQKGKS